MEYPWISLFLVILTTVIGFTNQCNVKFRIDPVIINEHESTTLQCSPNKSCTVEYVAFQRQVNGTVFETAAEIHLGTDTRTFNLTDGISYAGRVTGILYEKEYYLTIKREEAILEDGGLWKCVTHQDGVFSDESQLTVNSLVENVVVRLTEPTYILLGTAFSYTCMCDRVFPQPDVIWDINGIEYTNGTRNDHQTGVVWKILNIFDSTLWVRDTLTVKCILRASWSIENQGDHVNIYVPTTLENTFLSNHRPTPEQNLTMACTASGTYVEILWFHHGSNVDTTLFVQENRIVEGNFSFEEQTAVESVIYWMPINESVWCEELGRYNGQFWCSAEALKGPLVSSHKQDIIVEYSPILFVDKVDIKAAIGDTVELICGVKCSMPSIYTYHWSHTNRLNGLDQNTKSIKVEVTAEDLCGFYICDVDNRIGSASVAFEIRNISSEFGIWGTFAIGLTAGMIICGSICAGVFIYKKKYYQKRKKQDAKAIYQNEININSQMPDEQTNDVSTDNGNQEISYNNINLEDVTKYESLDLETLQHVRNQTYEELCES